MDNPEQPATTDKQRRWLQWGLIGTLLLILLMAFVRHVVITLPFPFPVEYGEGVVQNWTLRLGRAQALYPAVSADDLPWLHNPYGPLWFWLSAPFSTYGEGVFTAARTISLLFFGLSLFFLYHLCRRDLRPGAAACLCALFGASPLVWRYAVMARVDMAALAASLAALLMMEKGLAGWKGRPRAGENERLMRSGWFISGLAASAALLIKPVYAAAALTGLAAGLREGRGKMLSFTCGLALPLLGAALWILMRGEHAAEHFGEMNRIGLSIRQLAAISLAGAGRHPFLLLALFAGFSRIERWSPRWCFAVLMTASLLLGIKTGADAHYFIAPLTAGVLLAAPAAAMAGRRGGGAMLLWCMAAQLALYLPVAPQPVFTATYGQEVPAGHSALTPGESDREIGRLLADEISAIEGPILADDPGYLLAGGREVLIQPYQYGRLVRAGRIDTAALIERIETRFFTLVILRDESAGGPAGSDFPPDIVESVRRHYQLHREIGPYLLFVDD